MLEHKHKQSEKENDDKDTAGIIKYLKRFSQKVRNSYVPCTGWMILSGIHFETFTLFVENDVIMTEDGSEDTLKLVITLGNCFCVCNI